MDNIVNIQELEKESQVISIIDIEKKKIVDKTNNSNERHFIEIKRNIKDDTFSIKKIYFSREARKVNFKIQINNTPIDFFVGKKIKKESFEEFIIPFLELEKYKFSNLKSMSLISEEEIKENERKSLIVSQIKVNKKDLVQKEFFINDFINFKTIKAIKLSSFINNINDKFQNKYDNYIFNNIIFYPQKMLLGQHNEVLFKIVSFNEEYNKELLDRDLSLLPKTVSNLPISNGEKLNLYFEKNVEDEFILGKKVVGKIKIADETYYDFQKKETIKGANENSKKGFIVPYNYSGELFPKIDLDINNDYKNITLAFKQKIKYKYLDKNNGRIKFNITSYKEPRISESDHYFIKNKQFKYLLEANLTIEGLKNLYKRNEEDD
ncbi:MHO_1580 family protein [Mesomycoplasma molare]|uniref:Uncharacterized protein n=1 Tax=Mesomycoplasma molare TaxID=171288 RepID=A0ABY5TU65_9BACT|nr:hypothetical protein [Mesomycoplasma molare]UWD34125.1 hypothetical protein NX772_03490 [Mesomycoplasma molare]